MRAARDTVPPYWATAVRPGPGCRSTMGMLPRAMDERLPPVCGLQDAPPCAVTHVARELMQALT